MGRRVGRSSRRGFLRVGRWKWERSLVAWHMILWQPGLVRYVMWLESSCLRIWAYILFEWYNCLMHARNSMSKSQSIQWYKYIFSKVWISTWKGWHEQWLIVCSWDQIDIIQHPFPNFCSCGWAGCVYGGGYVCVTWKASPRYSRRFRNGCCQSNEER